MRFSEFCGVFSRTKTWQWRSIGRWFHFLVLKHEIHKYTRAALLLRHLCVRSESRKYSTAIHYVSHDAIHTSGLISWEILAKTESCSISICQLTILNSNGLPGCLDKRSMKRILRRSFSVRI